MGRRRALCPIFMRYGEYNVADDGDQKDTDAGKRTISNEACTTALSRASLFGGSVPVRVQSCCRQTRLLFVQWGPCAIIVIGIFDLKFEKIDENFMYSFDRFS